MGIISMQEWVTHSYTSTPSLPSLGTPSTLPPALDGLAVPVSPVVNDRLLFDAYLVVITLLTDFYVGDAPLIHDGAWSWVVVGLCSFSYQPAAHLIFNFVNVVSFAT